MAHPPNLNSSAIALAKSAWESILFTHDHRPKSNAYLAKNAALRILAASKGAGECWSGSHEDREREIATLLSAKVDDYLPKDFEPVGGGGEHLVFSADPPDGLFFKVTWRDYFGFVPAFDEDENLELRPATPAEYFLRCGLANVVFGDEIRLHSIVPDQVGNSEIPSIVTTQPFIVGRPSEPEEIVRYLEGLDFLCLNSAHDQASGLHDVWYRQADQVMICDAVAGNFVTTADGTVAAIDLPAALVDLS